MQEIEHLSEITVVVCDWGVQHIRQDNPYNDSKNINYKCFENNVQGRKCLTQNYTANMTSNKKWSKYTCAEGDNHNGRPGRLV